MLSFLLLLVVAAVLGSLGAALAGRRGNGCLVNILTGFVGAALGRWLARLIDFNDPLTLTLRETDFPLISTVAGAALFVAIITFLTRGRPRLFS